jgi:hypothetical protein
MAIPMTQDSSSDSDSITTRTIVPPRRPSTIHSFQSKPPTLHDFKSDLDPTEWKPHSTRPGHVRSQSAAFGYLAQFHRSASGFMALSNRRPPMPSRASTPIIPVVDTAPSEVQTPAMSSNGSTSSMESTYLRTPDHHANASAKLPGLTLTSLKSTELVKPIYDTAEGVIARDDALEMNYKKKTVAVQDEIAGSLTQLLSREAPVKV